MIAAYTAYWPASVRAATLPEGQAHDLLARFLVPKAVAEELAGAAEWKRKGWAPWGKVTVHVTKVEVNGRTARLDDCQDASAAAIENVRTRRPIPGTTGSRRTHLRADLVQGTDGRWRISDKKLLDTPCTPRPS